MRQETRTRALKEHCRATGLRSVLGLCVVAAASVLFAASSSTARATGVVDQSQETQTDLAGVALIGSQVAAQTFTVGRSGALDEIDLLLTRYGSPGSLTVEIHPTKAGVPTVDVLSSGTVVDTSLDSDPYTFEWLSVALNSAVAVTSGTQYAIVLRDAGGAVFPSDYFDWGESLADPYVSEMASTSVDNGTTWYLASDVDFAFRTYVDLPPPLLVRGSGIILQHTLGIFAFDVSYDGVTAYGAMRFALPVTYQGTPGYLTASSTAPSFAYVECRAGRPVSATFGGNGSFVLRSWRGTVVLSGPGYMKATVSNGRVGTLYGYVAPTGPPFMPEISFLPNSIFIGHLDITNASCPT